MADRVAHCHELGNGWKQVCGIEKGGGQAKGGVDGQEEEKGGH